MSIFCPVCRGIFACSFCTTKGGKDPSFADKMKAAREAKKASKPPEPKAPEPEKPSEPPANPEPPKAE